MQNINLTDRLIDELIKSLPGNLPKALTAMRKLPTDRALLLFAIITFYNSNKFYSCQKQFDKIIELFIEESKWTNKIGSV